MDGQMLDVGDELEPPDEKLLEGVQDGLIDIDHLAAPLTDEVVMVALFDVVIEEPALAKVGLSHQIELLEKLQCPVDGRTIDLRMCGMDLGEYILRGDMPIGTVERLQDRYSLGCKPVPLLFQSLKATHRDTPFIGFPA